MKNDKTRVNHSVSGQTILEYVLMLAVSLLIVGLIATFLKQPFENIVERYSTHIKKAVETGDITYGDPDSGGGKRFTYQ